MLSANGLFNHQHSHLYLKHVCDICEKRFQFPGQLKRHTKIHIGLGLFPCLHCDKKYTTNSAMLEHAKSHNVSLQCDLCPMSLGKRYNSTYALAQHQRGMHGPGWNTPCGRNYKWKSCYSRDMKSGCASCDQYRANKRKKRYFFCKVNLSSTVHFMNNVYMRLDHLFIWFLSQHLRIFFVLVCLHRLIRYVVSACSDKYFITPVKSF